MTTTLKTISDHLEVFAPLSLAEDWDNCGWQIFCGEHQVSKVMTTLSLTPTALQIAIDNNVTMVFAHHPLIFKGLKQIRPDGFSENMVLECIKHNISVYSAHTNIDKVKNGISDVMMQKLGIADTEVLFPDKIDSSVGFGRYGTLETSMKLEECINLIKEKLGVSQVKVTNNIGKTDIKTIAVCGGAGASFIPALPDSIDLYITGDVKYHEALENYKCVLVDANHVHTEQFIVDTMKDFLAPLGVDVTPYKTDNPWQLW